MNELCYNNTPIRVQILHNLVPLKSKIFTCIILSIYYCLCRYYRELLSKLVPMVFLLLMFNMPKLIEYGNKLYASMLTYSNQFPMTQTVTEVISIVSQNA